MRFNRKTSGKFHQPLLFNPYEGMDELYTLEVMEDTPSSKLIQINGSGYQTKVSFKETEFCGQRLFVVESERIYDDGREKIKADFTRESKVAALKDFILQREIALEEW
jgi:hypothetical protein